jgi:broad specificity phosphatase PhoE
MSDKQIVLVAARHGTTTLNASNCFRGNVNPPLAPEGFRDANKASHYLSGMKFSSIYTSPRLRATQTADAIVRNQNNQEYTEIPDLAALDVGDFSGQPKSPENVRKIEQYIDNSHIPIPGGESLDAFRARVRPIFVEAIKQFDLTGLPTLLVVHSSIIHELGSMFNDNHHSSRVEPGGIAAVYYDDGDLHAEPIFKPLKIKQGKADTIS